MKVNYRVLRDGERTNGAKGEMNSLWVSLIMLEHLKIKYGLTDGQWTVFKNIVEKLEVPAKMTLLQEGEVANRIFLIERGCIRSWFNNDGTDLTIQFFLENETVASIESFKKQIPSLMSLETIEPSSLWVIQRKDLERLLSELEKLPALRKQFIDQLFERMFDYMRHFLSFIKDTPAERYQQLLEDKPQLLQRVPQHYIASYLGISSVHLSRIKSRLLKRK